MLISWRPAPNIAITTRAPDRLSRISTSPPELLWTIRTGVSSHHRAAWVVSGGLEDGRPQAGAMITAARTSVRGSHDRCMFSPLWDSQGSMGYILPRNDTRASRCRSLACFAIRGLRCLTNSKGRLSNVNRPVSKRPRSLAKYGSRTDRDRGLETILLGSATRRSLRVHRSFFFEAARGAPQKACPIVDPEVSQPTAPQPWEGRPSTALRSEIPQPR
jgi:hypothetical protein